MNFNHVSCDLETWGTRPVCAVSSIGAVAFNPVTGLISPDRFYATISLKSCFDYKLFVEPDTLIWWMNQSDAARREATKGEYSLNDALQQFEAWWNRHSATYYWSHGANFDEPIQQALYRVTGKKAPWQYRNVRDTRTLFDLAKVKVQHAAGVHHVALDDAQAQAEAIIAGYKALGFAQTGPLTQHLADERAKILSVPTAQLPDAAALLAGSEHAP